MTILSGTNRYFNKVVARFGIEIDMVDPINLELFESKIRPNTAVSNNELIKNDRRLFLAT